MLQSLLNTSVHSLTYSYIVLYKIWSAFQMDQLTVAACIRLQPHNTEDESRGMTQTCTVRSNEQFERNSRTCMVKVHIFHFIKQPGRRNENADGQFVSTAFLESSSRFLRSSLFSSTTSSTTKLFASVYLRQLMTSQKASSHHAMHDRFYSTLDIKPLHVHSCCMN